MRRIRLLASCLADPSGIKFRGHEVEMPDDQASVMVATGQWEYVAPPSAKTNSEIPDPPIAGPSPRPPFQPPRREYRKRSV